MKAHCKLFLLILLAVAGLSAAAQFNVVVFAPKGEKFTLYINGHPENSEHAYRVEANNPGGPTFKIRVFFEDPSIREINKTIFNRPGGGTLYFKVSQNARGSYSLEAASSEWFDKGVEKEAKEATPPPAENKANKENVKESQAQDKPEGRKGCNNPMPDADFTASLVGISTGPFEPIKLSNAKKVAERNCLTTGQVVTIIRVFDTESSRLSFAKFAYSHTYNQSDYGDVKEALHSQKSKDELDRYISGK